MIVSFFRRFVLLTALFWATNPVFSQSVQLFMTTDSAAAHVGSPVRLTLKAVVPKGTKITLPEIKGDSERWELLQADSVQEKQTQEGVTVSQNYTIVVWDTGSVVIPAFPILYTLPNETGSQTAFSPALTLTMDLVKIDTAQAFKPIVPPLQTETIWQEYLMYAILGGFLILLLIIFLLWRRFRKQKASQILPQTNPPKPLYERALFRLKELADSQKLENKQHKAYYARLTDILRAYIELKSGVKATDLTTAEILKAYRTASPAQTEALKTMLELSDKVKFAKYEPDTKNGLEMMENAKNWVKGEANA